MFDRVYAPMVTTHIGFSRKLEAPEIPIEFSFSSDVIDEAAEWRRGAMSQWSDHVAPPPGCSFEEVDETYKLQAEQELENRYRSNGIMGVWCASEKGLFLKRFSQGEKNAFQGALNNLPIVRPDVSWDHVRAFREDPDSIRKYRDLRLWLSDIINATSERHATDIIAQRIEDYRWSIRKHGLETVTGAFASLWDWKQSVALAAGVGAAATLSGAVIASLMAGIAVTSGVGAYFAQRKISEIDVSRGEGREVAILVDIQNRFGGA